MYKKIIWISLLLLSGLIFSENNVPSIYSKRFKIPYKATSITIGQSFYEEQQNSILVGFAIRSNQTIEAITPIYREINLDGKLGKEYISEMRGSGEKTTEITYKKIGSYISELDLILSENSMDNIIGIRICWKYWSAAEDRTECSDIIGQKIISENNRRIKIKIKKDQIPIGIHGIASKQLHRISFITASLIPNLVKKETNVQIESLNTTNIKVYDYKVFERRFDNSEPTIFKKSGNESRWNEENSGFNENRFWIWNTRDQIKNFGTWKIELPESGNYDFFYYTKNDDSSIGNAAFSITDYGWFWLNHSIKYKTDWTYIGSLYYDKHKEFEITTSDATFQEPNTKKVVFDAILCVQINYNKGELSDRIIQTEIPLNHRVLYDKGSVRPSIILSPLSNNDAMIGWNEYDGRNKERNTNIHLNYLNPNLTLKEEDTLIKDSLLGGLTVDKNGYAIATKKGDKFILQKFNTYHKQEFKTNLIGERSKSEYMSKFDPMKHGSSRLIWSGSKYGLYFAHQMEFAKSNEKSNIRQGGYLAVVSSKGQLLENESCTWCISHSFDQRLIWDGKSFIGLGVGDAYPNSIGYIVGKNTKEIFSFKTVGFYPKAYLGNILPTKDGNIVVFSTGDGRNSMDICFMLVDSDGNIKKQAWLTNTLEIAETNVKLARYGENFLLAYQASGNYVVSIIDANGSILKGPNKIDAEFNNGDDFINFSNGDVGWTYSSLDQMKINVVRFKLVK